jgi:hypothetical protein
LSRADTGTASSPDAAPGPWTRRHRRQHTACGQSDLLKNT